MTTPNSALTGHHAVVTGGSRGIGLTIARTLLGAGANVTIMARDAKKLDAAVVELRCRLQGTDAQPEAVGSVFAVMVNVADEASVAAAFAAARDVHGPIDILVNNAGIAESAPFARTGLAQFERLLDVNLKGVWLCTQEFAADLPTRPDGRQRRVINVASTAAQRGYAYVSAYCAAKHGVLGLTRALAVEWARKDVTVNAVCPGYTDTDIVADAVANIVARTGRDADATRAELARGNPQGRLVTPEQVANTVLWLASPGSDAINGQAISISGGEVMN